MGASSEASGTVLGSSSLNGYHRFEREYFGRWKKRTEHSVPRDLCFLPDPADDKTLREWLDKNKLAHIPSTHIYKWGQHLFFDGSRMSNVEVLGERPPDVETTETKPYTTRVDITYTPVVIGRISEDREDRGEFTGVPRELEQILREKGFKKIES